VTLTVEALGCAYEYATAGNVVDASAIGTTTAIPQESASVT